MTELTKEQSIAADIGYAIGQKREQLGLSVEDIAQAIRLRPRQVAAIENGALDQLPGEPYTRSYLKRTIEFLELDSTELLGRYDGGVKPEARKLFVLPEIFSAETHADGLLALIGLILALILVALWNWANPVVTAPLVMPFEPLEARSAQVLPHRCAKAGDSYPPCSWEQLELWYQPVKPDYHIFPVHEVDGE